MPDKITIEFTREELENLFDLLLAPASILKTFQLISNDVGESYKTAIDKIEEINNKLNKLEGKEEK